MLRASLRFAAASAAVILSGCSSTEPKSSAADPYAGLEPQILAWRDALEAGHPACRTKVAGKGCESFEVKCKAAQTITPDEAGRGVSAKLVAAMTFNARNADGSSGQPGSAFAVFAKTGKLWTRTEAAPVNMSTCAPA